MRHQFTTQPRRAVVDIPFSSSESTSSSRRGLEFERPTPATARTAVTDDTLNSVAVSCFALARKSIASDTAPACHSDQKDKHYAQSPQHQTTVLRPRLDYDRQATSAVDADRASQSDLSPSGGGYSFPVCCSQAGDGRGRAVHHKMYMRLC